MRHDDDDDDDDDESGPIARRRRSRANAANRQLLALAGVGVAAIVLLACGVVVLNLARSSATRRHQEWTHAELFAFLKSKGVVTDMGQYGPDSTIFMTPAANMDIATHFLENGATLEGAVLVTKHQTPAAAREYAGMSAAGNRRAWGRFTFRGDKALIERIAAVLP